MKILLRPRHFFKLCHRTIITQQLIYEEHGDPTKVLRLAQSELPDALGKNEIRLAFLASPVNPADVNMIQGVYGIKPKLPAVGGNEGVARVDEVGPQVSNLRVGDWVQPTLANFGTWRTRAVCSEDSVTKIDNTIPLVSAATLSINPPTAYRILSDFVDLKAGDCVIQNGANSGVGRALIQIAKTRDLITVNIVRQRPDLDDLRNELSSIGADYVLTEEELKGDFGKKLWSEKNVPKPKLAVNCVSGRSTLYLAGALTENGILVTYGAMSMQPAQIPASAFIFKNVQAMGFWLSRWKDENVASANVKKMFDDLTSLIKKDKLKPPTCDLVDFKDYKTAAEKSLLKGYSKKQILVFDWTL